MKYTKYYWGIVIGSLTLFSSCNDTVYNGDKLQTVKDTLTSAFDFATDNTYDLKVNYNVPKGYNIGFKVYTENPIEIGEGGQIKLKKGLEPIDAGFTDEMGLYNYPIQGVPSSIQTLYVYTDYPGVPMLMTANVNNGLLSEAIPGVESENKILASRSVSVYTTFTGFNPNPKTLGSWVNANGFYGRPDYLLKNSIDVPYEAMNAIRSVLPEGGHPKEDLIKNGDINVTDSAEIDLYMISESTGAFNTFAYFCYPTGKKPLKIGDISNNITVIFPNAKKVGSIGGYGAIDQHKNEGIRLHYFEGGVDKGTVFPKGTSIGWVIYNNSYKDAARSGKPISFYGNGGTMRGDFYSVKEFNNDGRQHMALFRYKDFVAIGMEDWGPGSDYDYNDIVFNVKATPITAITTDVPEVNPSESPETVESSQKGVLAFEDLWPHQGDFDLNDVVVGYHSTVYQNSKNEITSVKDSFTLQWTGAGFTSSFAYQMNVPRSNIASVTFSDPSLNAEIDPKENMATIRLFKNTLGEEKPKTVEVIVRFKTPINKAAFMRAPYNPFINPGGNAGSEVHLTQMKPTSQMDTKLLGSFDDCSKSGQNIYYVTFQKDGEGYFTKQQMPFAIHLKDLDVKSFVIPKESQHLDLYYPKFLNWVNSKGQIDKDWFRYPLNKE